MYRVARMLALPIAATAAPLCLAQSRSSRGGRGRRRERSGAARSVRPPRPAGGDGGVGREQRVAPTVAPLLGDPFRIRSMRT
jgi:hypothetical protein